MKYKYIIHYEPINDEAWEIESKLLYSDPYNALKAATELVMRQHVRHPHMLNQYCRCIAVHDRHGMCILSMGTRFFVNNL